MIGTGLVLFGAMLVLLILGAVLMALPERPVLDKDIPIPYCVVAGFLLCSLAEWLPSVIGGLVALAGLGLICRPLTRRLVGLPRKAKP